MRIVARPDFDGIVCAVLLFDVLDIAAETLWVEPAEIQKKTVDIRSGDIVANLPYADGCSFWFDHHYTNRIDIPFEGKFKIAPSAAGVIFEYYQGKFHHDFGELVAAADKIDSADLTLEEVQHPENDDYVLLSMTISDGLHTDVAYWKKLVGLLGEKGIGEVMNDDEVRQRCQIVIEQNEQYVGYLKKYTRVEQHVGISDFRSLAKIPLGNRFLVYSLFPDTVVNMRIRYEDPSKETIAVNVGHSIFNPNCNVNAGLMLTDFEGGGHRGAGSCRFHSSKADDYIPRITDILKKNENNET